MKKKSLFLVCCLLVVSLIGSARDLFPKRVSIPSDIPTNASVNVAWGGDMCEVNGFIYYVAYGTIVRMNPDGCNPTPVTGEHANISQLTSDNNNLYFVASSGTLATLYRLPLSGGKEQPVAEGDFGALQAANGKLYWKEYQDTKIQINCVNPDGSELRALFTQNTSDSVGFEFLVTGEGIYYAADYDLYRMDLSGNNPVKLNNKPLGSIFKLFYDRGKLYFIMDNGSYSLDSFWASLYTIDDWGNIKAITPVGYYPQDYGEIQYCGISDNLLYYFIPTNDSYQHVWMDMYQFDLATGNETMILRHQEMGDASVGTLSSLRGKSIPNIGVVGLYILGNDIYFSTYSLP